MKTKMLQEHWLQLKWSFYWERKLTFDGEDKNLVGEIFQGGGVDEQIFSWWGGLPAFLLPVGKTLLIYTLIVVYLHCVSVLCFLLILLNKIVRHLTISFPLSFNHSFLLHPNLSLVLLFFSLNLAFVVISSVICFSFYWLKLFISFSIILSHSLSIVQPPPLF